MESESKVAKRDRFRRSLANAGEMPAPLEAHDNRGLGMAGRRRQRFRNGKS
jgi:hypothetical protein